MTMSYPVCLMREYDESKLMAWVHDRFVVDEQLQGVLEACQQRNVSPEQDNYCSSV